MAHVLESNGAMLQQVCICPRVVLGAIPAALELPAPISRMCLESSPPAQGRAEGSEAEEAGTSPQPRAAPFLAP